MNIKLLFISLISSISLNTVRASDIVAAKVSDSSLSLMQADKHLVCNTQFEYKEIKLSSDGQFLIFSLSKPEFKGHIADVFTDVVSAFNTCMQGGEIAIKSTMSTPDYAAIIDVNKKSNMAVTNEVYLYNTGGNTIAAKIVARVWNYDTSKEIHFYFSPSKSNLKSMTKSNFDSNLMDKAFDSPAPIENQDNMVKINVISPDGKFIAPVGTICGIDEGGIWNVETKQPVSFEGLDASESTAKCKEIFK